MSFLWRCSCYGVIFIIFSTGIAAYNFDVDNLIIYEDAAGIEGFRGSYSGISVALWNPGNAGLGQSWMFIGAPRANSSTYGNVNEPGSVFKCQIGKQCKEWIMDSSAGTGPGDGSWLGSSLGIQDGDDPIVVVCGPRWIDKRRLANGAYPDAWPMKGICYKAPARNLTVSETTKGVPILPFGAPIKNSNDHMMGESGFSLHMVNELNPSIILGCPGFKYGLGTPIQYSINRDSFLIPNTAVDYSVQSYYDYSGYAVTSGYYFGRQGGRWYATSAPRSRNLEGRVILFRFGSGNTRKILFNQSVLGEQVGEYFGSVLASCDINGDRSDDLIVGAPQWTKNVDEGQIYYFRGDSRSGMFKKMPNIQGETPHGRFGSAVTCLGDIDYDGYADIAVGAPYEGNGAVYIYHGSKQGLILSQKISSPKDTKGFGISISEPRDIDNNDYADIAVGAYLSGHVILFRSKRAVTTQVNLTLVTDSEEKSLQRNATSFAIEICSSYDGKHAPQQLNVTKVLKIDEIHQRAEIKIYNKYQRTYEFHNTLNFRKKLCNNFTILIKNNSQNKNFLDPLKLSVVQRLDTRNEHNGTMLLRKNSVTGKEYFNTSSAVVNELHRLAESFLDVPFALMCKNKICNSHLSIQMVTNLGSGNTYVIGSEKYVQLNITVSNSKDEAYLTKAVVVIPIPIRITHIPSTICTRYPLGKNIQVTCDIGNPLDKNESITVSLSLDMSLVSTTQIYLNATATTQSRDAASGDHIYNLPINFATQTDIGITRKSTVDRFSYTRTGKVEQLQSIAFQHIYQIKNYELTSIPQALLSVSIPTHWIYAGNEIEIIRLNKTLGYLEMQEFYCTDEYIGSASHDATTETEWLTGNTSSMSDEKFTVIENTIFAASPDNRTLYMNCTNPLVKWKTIHCKLGPFEGTQPVAKLVLIFDLLLSNLSSGIIQEKDIIFFTTNSSVKVLGLPGETINKEPNFFMIGTIFIGSLPDNRVPAWIIALSVVVGLLLLILLILGLIKLGFFKRNKQMELRALLKKEDAVTPEIVPDSN